MKRNTDAASGEKTIEEQPYTCPNCFKECDGTKQLCPECNELWKRASDYIGKVLTRDGAISLDTKTFADFAAEQTAELRAEVERLRAENERLKRPSWNSSLDEALNSGDGTYKP